MEADDVEQNLMKRARSSSNEIGFGEPDMEEVRHYQWRTVSKRGRIFLMKPAVWSCLLYSVVSVGMTLVNKIILNKYHFHPKMTLLFIQNLICLTLLVGARLLKLVEFETSLKPNSLIAWIPLNILFTLMLLTSFMSMELLSVPMITIFKNCTNVLTCFGDLAIYNQPVSRGIVASLVLMVFAAVLTGMYDLEFDAIGYFWAIVNCVCTASYVLYMPKAMQGANLNSFGKVYYNNILSLPLILLVDSVYTNELSRFFDESSDQSRAILADAGFIFVLIVSGAMGFFLSFSSFICVQTTSPTTYAMVGAMNKVPLTIIGIIIFNTQVDVNSMTFISMSVLAGFLYSYTKAISK